MATLPADPLILCYDGSKGCQARRRARRGLVRRRACPGPDAQLRRDRSRGRRGRRQDRRGGRRHRAGGGPERRAGRGREPGAVWETIVEIADRHQAAMIVMGSRAHRPALNAAGQRLQRSRPPRPPAHPRHPPAQRRPCRQVAPGPHPEARCGEAPLACVGRWARPRARCADEGPSRWTTELH